MADLKNIQGDILPSLPKKTETFFFFKIVGDINNFKKHLGQLLPHITTGAGVREDRKKIDEHKKHRRPGLLKISGINIAFSREGLAKFGLNRNDGDKLNDAAFDAGMFADAQALGDKGAVNADNTFTPAWEHAFAKQDIDGVILIAGDCRSTVSQALTVVKGIFKFKADGASIEEALTIVGDVRPGDQDGHEHFGFQDGISNPAINGINTSPNPGQITIQQGIVLMGRDGDRARDNGTTPGAPIVRPSWALDGTFLCFRKLAQRVPEFDEFLSQNAIKVDDPSAPPDLGKELLGARLVGRWKSGAPVEITPVRDDPVLAEDPSRNNAFSFANEPGRLCPFAAHIRKTNPRDDLRLPNLSDGALNQHLMLRRGIQYGPEVTPDEAAAKQTKEDRGLLFVSYQSNIKNGFEFVQKQWANSPNFIFTASPPPGFDPIVGQNSTDEQRTITGFDPKDSTTSLNLGTQEWVVSKGGAYFFTPSMPTLREKFAAAAA